MERVTTWEHNPAILEARQRIPQRLWDRAPFHLFTGDPVFAGVHRFEQTGDGRSYRETAHCCYRSHTADRMATVVLPEGRENRGVMTVVHEFGHVLHETVGFWPWAGAVSDYAERNVYEAFAEAFCLWVMPEYAWWEGVNFRWVDARTRSLLEDLTLG